MNNLREPVIDASAWTAAQMAACDDWVMSLDDAARGEIDTALGHALQNGLDPLVHGPSAFPLPRFAAVLDEVIDELENGRGFVLVRGLDLDRYC